MKPDELACADVLPKYLINRNRWKKKKAEHVEVKKIKSGSNVFFTGMTKEEKNMPIIALLEITHRVQCEVVGLYAYS